MSVLLIERSSQLETFHNACVVTPLTHPTLVVLTVQEGKDILPAKLNTTSTALFCTVGVGGVKKKSKTIKNSLEPKWGQVFELCDIISPITLSLHWLIFSGQCRALYLKDTQSKTTLFGILAFCSLFFGVMILLIFLTFFIAM
jgi:hypothetical protein